MNRRLAERSDYRRGKEEKTTRFALCFEVIFAGVARFERRPVGACCQTVVSLDCDSGGIASSRAGTWACSLDARLTPFGDACVRPSSPALSPP